MQRGVKKRWRSGAVALMVCLVGTSVPAPAAAASLDTAGKVTGFVAISAAETLANRQVRLRNIDAGQVTAVASTDGTGAYAFAGLVAGNYMVELMGETGHVVGTSAPVIVSTAQPAVKDVLVTSASAFEEGGAISGRHRGGAFFRSKAGITMMAATGVGVTGIMMGKRNTKNASPSN